MSIEDKGNNTKTTVKKNLVSIKKTNPSPIISKNVSKGIQTKKKKLKVKKSLVSINNSSQSSPKQVEKKGKRKLNNSKEHKVVKKIKKIS